MVKSLLPLVLKQVNAALVATRSIIHMQNCAFLTLLKIVKVFNQELMKEDTQNDMKRVSVNVDQMQMFEIINNVRMMINAGVNAKN